MTSCRGETETVSGMEKAGLFNCCWRYQSVASLSLLVSGLMVDILTTFCDVFMVQCFKIMLKSYEFGVLLFDFNCLLPKCNLS